MTHPESVIPKFEQELRDLGYKFEIEQQVHCFLPEHKETILPIAVKYYKQAPYEEEKQVFIGFFHYKGFEEVVPMLLEDFYLEETPPLTRECIGDALLEIRSKKYVDDYIKIISEEKYEIARAPIFMLIGRLKVEQAIPVLKDLMSKPEPKEIHWILRAMKGYKREEFRPYFEAYVDSQDKELRKIASSALAKLG